MNKIIAAIAIPVVAGTALLTGCSHFGGGDSAASASAAAKALASDPAALKDKAQAKALAEKCLPVKKTDNILTQYHYVRYFIAGPKSKYAAKGKAERAKLSDCAGVPESKRPAFYNDLKTSGVTAVGAYVKGDHKAIRAWLLTTAPETAKKYQVK